MKTPRPEKDSPIRETLMVDGNHITADKLFIDFANT